MTSFLSAADVALMRGTLLGLAQSIGTTCTIQANAPTQDTTGQPVDNWSNVPGLVNLPCRIGPGSGNEIRRPDQTVATVTRTVTLTNYYPQITELMRVVASDGNTYNILLVGGDSLLLATQLHCEVKR